MVAAVVSDGKTVDAGYLTSGGARAALTDKAQAQLAAIAGSRKPVTLDLDGLGRYRVVAAPSRRGGDVIVTGLSMADVDATMIRMLVIFGIVDGDRAGRRDDRRRRHHQASAGAAAPRRANRAQSRRACRWPAVRSNCRCGCPNPTPIPQPRWVNSGRR